MSSRFALIAGVLLASLTTLPLSAQQSTGSTMRDTSARRDTSGAKAPVARGASSDSALVELGRAITALAVSVQTVVAETAKSPELRHAALQTAGKAVSLAQQTLDENRGQIERLLAEAGRKLAAIDTAAKTKPTKPATP
jgi:hypothetical protein